MHLLCAVYSRLDFSAELAWEARREFAACLAAGEAALPLARAALLVAAEDDAIGVRCRASAAHTAGT